MRGTSRKSGGVGHVPPSSYGGAAHVYNDIFNSDFHNSHLFISYQEYKYSQNSTCRRSVNALVAVNGHNAYVWTERVPVHEMVCSQTHNLSEPQRRGICGYHARYVTVSKLITLEQLAYPSNPTQIREYFPPHPYGTL